MEHDSTLTNKMRSRSSPNRGQSYAIRHRSPSQQQYAPEHLIEDYRESYRHSRERGRERDKTSRSPPYHDQSDHLESRKPPTGPQKPLRNIDRRKTISR